MNEQNKILEAAEKAAVKVNPRKAKMTSEESEAMRKRLFGIEG